MACDRRAETPLVDPTTTQGGDGTTIGDAPTGQPGARSAPERDGPEPLFCQRCGHETEPRPVDGRERPVCAACGAVTYLDPKLAVAVLIEDRGRILLGRRGPGTREAGRWSFPAGFVERGEAVEAAARREVREEVGLEVRLGPLLALISSEGETVVLAIYEAVGFTGEPVAGDDLIEVGWFGADALPDLAFGHDRRTIELWRALRRA